MYNKTENILFLLIKKLPEKFIPHFLMEWLQQYMYKRIAELNQQIVQDKWKSMELHKIADTIRQDINKTPSGD